MSRNFSLTRSRLWRTRAATALAAAGALVMSGGLVLLAAPTASADPPGNNGTVKVGDSGDIDEQRPENDPHLPCTFNIQWFNFDSGWGTLDASVLFELQEPTGTDTNSMTVTGDTSPSFVGNGGQPGAGDSVDHTEWYTLAFTGPPQDQQGFHVKITVTTPHSKGNDEKHKVFWVGPCATTVPIPAAPSQTDPCGPNNATWNLPADTETLDWTLVNGVLSVTIKPANTTFSDGTRSHSYGTATDSNAPCGETVPIPAAPSQSDPCGSGNATWNVPADTATLDWSLTGGVLSVSIIPTNVTFTDGTRTHSYGSASDSNTPCPETVQIPATPSQNDPCGSGNASWNVPADTATLDWSLTSGVLSVAIIPANVTFTDGTRTHSYGTATDSNEPCIAGVEEISPDVTFTEPDCDNLDGADWSGNLTDLVDYSIEGTPGLGESVTVTATIKASEADSFAFPAGFDNTFDHTYVTEAELACPTVKGSESVRPKPHKTRTPVVLGTQAVAPTAVNAGLTSLPATGSSSNTLLAQLMVGGGMLLLLAGGWLGFGRREYGAHQA